MIKIQRNEATNTQKLPKYPWLGELNGMVVWFVGPERGVPLISDLKDFAVGDKCVIRREHCFVPFNGSITLSNEVES